MKMRFAMGEGKLRLRTKAGSIVLSICDNESTVNGRRVAISNTTISRVYLDKETKQ
ncbi:MAG: hypothetical protein WC431_00395 [Candidatus Omnitrophota bacterium]|jgi:hypothetical protein